MASVKQVADTLALLIQPIVYPSGIESASVTGRDIKIFQGWPLPEDIDDFVCKRGNAIVSIYAGNIEHNSTRGLGNLWEEMSINEEAGTGESLKEVKRQERQFHITVWAADPDTRSLVADAIDPVLSDTFRIKLPDGTVGNLSYVTGIPSDANQAQDAYRYDFLYQVEYATAIVETDQIVRGTTVNISQLI